MPGRRTLPYPSCTRTDGRGGAMVTTVLEAHVEAERWSELRAGYERIVAQLPPQMVATDLTQGAEDRGLWTISTVWVSMEGLQEYRRSVETPDGLRLFREVGAEPRLTVFEVVSRVSSRVSRSEGQSAAASGEGPARKIADASAGTP